MSAPQRITRKQRPERIRVGGEDFERNDLTSARFGESERTTNRNDKFGAPYIYFGGVKYRPVQRYDAFILTRIKQTRPEPTRHIRRGRSINLNQKARPP